MSTERLSPAEAFEVLGDELRLEVLRTLSKADDPLTFSGLRERTGVRDSGRFNYHLDRLRGHFVRRTDDGYELRFHGHRVVETVLAGTFTDTVEVDPFAVEGSCYACDGSLRGTYEDERVTIACTDCDERVLSVPFPPSGLHGRDPEELMAAYRRWSRARVDVAADGVCPACSGPVERRLVDPADRVPFECLPAFDCTACTSRTVTSFAALALRRPVVERFYADQGVDLEERPYWDLEPCVTGEHTTVESTDPLRAVVAFPAGDERLRVTLDDDLSVDRSVRESV